MERCIDRRSALCTAACSGMAALCLAGCHTSEPVQTDERVANDWEASDDTALEPTTTPSGEMPFSLDGVPADGDVLQAQGSGDAATLHNEWSFGGDYVRIGSFPVDGQTVFGSATDDANDVSSYVAALITPEHATELEIPQGADSETFFEPQDGSGTADLIVWRCCELSNPPTTGADNWQIRAWDSASGQTRIIASANDLNGRGDTPMLDAEVVPTTDGSRVYFASMRCEEDVWNPIALAYGLDGVDKPVILGVGNYPAAYGEGGLWASSEDSGLCTILMRWNGNTSTRVFSLESEGNWGISGVWASGTTTAVGFSSSDSGQGSYIGIWQDDFTDFLCWIYTDAPRALGSLNGSWFVWGAGSEAENADMFALNLGSRQVLLLGNAPGYSRPTIAQESNVVMVPVANGMGAVKFRVGSLD